MDDDDRMDRGPNGIVRIVVFALVGMIMVTTGAIPILAQTISDNGLSDTPIGMMIGMIPLLMVVGIVLFIVNRSKLSDR